MNDAMMVAVLCCFIQAVMILIFAMTPYLSRRTECFGVSIPASSADHPSLRAWRKRYAWEMTLWGIALTLAAGALVAAGFLVLPLVLSLFLVMGVSFWLYLRYRRKVLGLKEREGWALRTDTRLAVPVGMDSGRGGVSLWWCLVFVAIAAGTGLATAALYPTLPEILPTRYGITGAVDAFTAKSWLAAMQMPLIQLFLCFVFGLTLWISSASRTVVDPENPEESLQRSVRFRRGWGRFLVACGILTLLMFTAIQFVILGLLPAGLLIPISLSVPAVIIVCAIFLSVRLGQGGSRIKLRGPASDTISVQDDDKYWKAGCFYYNPDDPALFVEKRFGVGWTSNFARPMTYVLLGAILLFPLLLVLTLI